MITIQFRNLKDALNIYEQLFYSDEERVLSLKMIQEPESLVKITWENNDDSCIERLIIPVLTKYIMTHIEVKWMKDMIRTMFYYSDIEEQEQILSIARSILDGDKDDIPGIPHLKDHLSRKEIIKESFLNFLTKSVSFSFESFLQFRLKDYRYRLLKYVEKAIDEYKLEQEYQTFIENLRTYVYEKKPIIEEIHLLHDQSFLFFDENFRPFQEEILKRVVDPNLLDVEEIDVESLVIAPLISMAPQKIHLYSNDLDDGIVQTIQNIFLEKVILHPKNKFYQFSVK